MGMNPIRLSHSALDQFLTCERMFQLDRLLEGAPAKQDYPATVFGKAFGVGVATYMTTQSQEQALFAAWLEYFPVLEEKNKTELSCIFALMAAFPSLDNLLQDWEVPFFNSKPAVELSFRLNINEGFYFVGYIDVTLKNRFTGKYAVLEVKTTGLGLIDLDPLYKNSGQAVGYSIVLDAIAGEENAEYDVIYLVAQLNSKTDYSVQIKTIPYPKTIRDRLDWFISLGMDVNRLEQNQEYDIFPRRGKSCLQYMRPCKHFGTCHLRGLDMPKEIPPDLIDYQFVYSLDDLIANHIQRISGGE